MDSTNPLFGVKALLFDVFGTVVDWQGSVHKQLEQYVKADRLDIGTIDLLVFTQVWRAGYMRRTKAIAAGEPGPTNVDVLHRELLDELLLSPVYAVLDSAWDDSARSELCQFWHKLDGWPGSSSGIKALTALTGEEALLVGTLSNGSARLLIDLAKHAELPWNVIFSGDILKAYKPNPATYLGACELIDYKPEQVAMVAAHIYDLRSAAKYGLRTIYVPRMTEDTDVAGLPDGPLSVKTKANGGEVDCIVHSLAELTGLFGR